MNKNYSIAPSLTEKQKKLCMALFNVGAVCFGNFKLKLHERFPDAPLSPDYINLRILQRFPEVKKMAIISYLELLKPLEFDLLAGIPIAAVAFTSSISDSLKIGMVTPRISEKNHGSGAKADGFLESDKGKRVVLIDDLITSADSKFEAIKILEQLGLKVIDVVVLIDREQEGARELIKKGYCLHAAMKRSQMLNYYLEEKIITREVFEDITKRTIVLNKYLLNHQ